MTKKQKEALVCLKLTREIAHNIIHRMTLWQLVVKGGWWRKQYDSACAEITRLNAEVD